MCSHAAAMDTDLQNLRIVRRAEVEHVTGLSRATLYRMIAAGRFPAPVRLGKGAVGWRQSEVRAWLESREPATCNVATGVDESPGEAAQ